MPINDVSSNTSPPPIRRHEEIPVSQPTSPKNQKLHSLAKGSFKEKKIEKPEKKITNPKVKTEKKSEALDKRTEGDWVCTDRKKGENGGYIYKLEFVGSMREKAKVSKIMNGPVSHSIVDDKDNSLLEALGYKLEENEIETILHLPDKHELETRLKILKKNNSFLKDIDIHPEVEPRDRTICEALCNGKVVLSNDHFLNDNLVFLQTLNRLIKEGPEGLNKVIKEFAKSYQNVKDARKVYQQSKGDPLIAAKIEFLEYLYSKTAQKILEHPSSNLTLNEFVSKAEQDEEVDALIEEKGLTNKSYELMDESINGKLIIPLKIAQGNKTSNVTKQEEIKSEEQEIKSKNGNLWDCIGRESLNGGFVYKFKLKNLNPDEVAHMEEKIFPALEPHAMNAIYIPSSDHFNDPLVKNYNNLLLTLGYNRERNSDSDIIYIPNREALLNGWNKLREQNPSLPEIEIVNSAGIASDLEYYQVYMDGKMLLSDGIEFIHDSTIHILPTLILKINSTTDPQIEEVFNALKLSCIYLIKN